MEGDLPLEVVVAQRLSHPGLVKTLAHATAGPPAAAVAASPILRRSLERACSMPSDSAVPRFAPPTPRLEERSSCERELDAALGPPKPDERCLRIACNPGAAAGAAGAAAGAAPGCTLERVSHARERAWHNSPKRGAVRRSCSGVLPMNLGMDPAPAPKGGRDGSGGGGARMQDACGIAQRDDSVGAMGGGAPAPSIAYRSAPGETWLLLELCDRGSLQVRGPGSLAGQLDFVRVWQLSVLLKMGLQVRGLRPNED